MKFIASCTIFTRIFWPTSITEIINISGSTRPFFTKQGPLDLQLDNKSSHIIEVISNALKNSPESLSNGTKVGVHCMEYGGVSTATMRDLKSVEIKSG